MSHRRIANEWIPLSDGARLAARIWLPEDAAPVPAILEYVPYRKNDATAIGDSQRHAWLAEHGYAGVRVDLRGSGDSDGVLLDEYLRQEQDDAVEVIAWIAAQPWCSGEVGMMGISWGGFNSLQVAARRPPALKAVLSLCSTDDRYATDVHYMGGLLLAHIGTFHWASTMLALNARPPDPEVSGERWREKWLERLEGSPPFMEAWLSHQRRDDYWRHGSVCEDYGAIECPVYMVGGWADAYRSAVLRFLAGYPGPRKGLIGPWGHQWPYAGVPGPAIGFLQESLRWWDQHLKGVDTGIMEEPMLRVWMQDAVRPAAFVPERPGRWVAEPSWPSPGVEERELELAFPRREVATSLLSGLDAGDWCSFAAPDLPLDQRFEDSLALTWDSEPLAERTEVLGLPAVELELAADRPVAMVAVRICDVAPNGTSALVARGQLNLAPAVPGETATVTVPCEAIAYAVPAGHRLRVAVTPAYVLWAWPSPEPVTLTVTGGRLRLPVRPPRDEEDARLAPFGPPERAGALPHEVVSAPPEERRITRDIARGTVVAELRRPLDRRRLLETGLEFGDGMRDVYTLVEDDPLATRAETWRTCVYRRGDWSARVETASTLTADAREFLLTNALEAYEGERRVFASTRTARIPRDGI